MRIAFIIEPDDREIMAWHAVVNRGITGSDIRDMMPEAIDELLGALLAPETI